MIMKYCVNLISYQEEFILVFRVLPLVSIILRRVIPGLPSCLVYTDNIQMDGKMKIYVEALSHS
jgi:hypothetical protein